jgi:hypothetical protein
MLIITIAFFHPAARRPPLARVSDLAQQRRPDRQADYLGAQIRRDP